MYTEKSLVVESHDDVLTVSLDDDCCSLLPAGLLSADATLSQRPSPQIYLHLMLLLRTGMSCHSNIFNNILKY